MANVLVRETLTLVVLPLLQNSRANIDIFDLIKTSEFFCHKHLRVFHQRHAITLDMEYHLHFMVGHCLRYGISWYVIAFHCKLMSWL